MYFTKNGGNNSTGRAAYMYGVVGKIERIDVRCYRTIYNRKLRAVCHLRTSGKMGEIMRRGCDCIRFGW